MIVVVFRRSALVRVRFVVDVNFVLPVVDPNARARNGLVRFDRGCVGARGPERPTDGASCERAQDCACIADRWTGVRRRRAQAT